MLRGRSDDTDHEGAASRQPHAGAPSALPLIGRREFASPTRDVSGRHGSSGRTRSSIACNDVH